MGEVPSDMKQLLAKADAIRNGQKDIESKLDKIISKLEEVISGLDTVARAVDSLRGKGPFGVNE